AQRGERLVALRGLADDAHPDLRMAEVRRRLDRGDRREPDPRIRDLPRDDLPDLLPQQLIDPLGSLAHGLMLPCRLIELPRRPHGRSGEGAPEYRSERTPRCVSDGTEGATHA